MSGGNVFDWLNHWGVPDDREAAGLLRSLLRSIRFCNANGFCHRDVKLSNLLFAQRGRNRLSDVVLADFGMAARVGEDGLVRGR
ncbi:unnamed protein product [Discosporangium mesarthrocarpum]